MDKALPPGLHIVATPIGNLGDLSPRAADTLRNADLILVEDTRVTAKLLAHIGAKVPMVRYDDHSERAAARTRSSRGSAEKRSRWSATPARRSSPIPATSWCARRGRPGTRCTRFPAHARRSPR